MKQIAISVLISNFNLTINIIIEFILIIITCMLYKEEIALIINRTKNTNFSLKK